MPGRIDPGFGRYRSVAAYLLALSSFRKPLPPLASLNSKWFRADLTFRDPCAKYFARWRIPSLGIPRGDSTSPLPYGSLYGSAVETKPVRAAYIPRWNQFANFGTIRVSQDKTLPVKVTFQAKESRSWATRCLLLLVQSFLASCRMAQFYNFLVSFLVSEWF